MDGKVKKLRTDAAATRRLSIELPEDLHRAIKAECANRGVKMKDAIQNLLEQHFLPGDGA